MSTRNNSQSAPILNRPEAIGTHGKTPVSRKSKGQARSVPKSSTKTKVDLVLTHLRRANGITLAQLMASTGWQAHSVRAVICGLRKQGISIVRFNTKNGATAYRAERTSS
jgi:hypothetical protein